MTTLREAATSAWQASQSDRETEARARLTDVLTGWDGVPSLTVADVIVKDTFTLYVFTDGDIHLGVRDRGNGFQDVQLVEPAGDGIHGWTGVGPLIASLASLGKAIPDFDPVDENATTYPEWVQPTGSTDAYSLGDRVTHNGKVWESLVDANVWEPGVSQWREVV